MSQGLALGFRIRSLGVSECEASAPGDVEDSRRPNRSAGLGAQDRLYPKGPSTIIVAT